MFRKNEIVPSLEISGIDEEGRGVGERDEKTFFVKGAVAGDIVDVKIRKARKNFYEGMIEKIISPSENRIEARCKHFGICGGCRWQMMDYETQLYYKEEKVKKIFENAGIKIPSVRPIVPSDRQYFYRNKLEFTFTNRKWLTQEQIRSDETIENKNALGFHVPGRFDKVLDIEECFLQDERTSGIVNEMKKLVNEKQYATYDLLNRNGFLRNIVLRNSQTTDEWMLILIVTENDKEKIDFILNHLQKKFSFLSTLVYIVNKKDNDSYYDLSCEIWSGKGFITEMIGNTKYQIGPLSFFQTNTLQGKKIYDIVMNLCEPKKTDVIYDLYTGAGTIANYVAKKVAKVVGMEYFPSAIEDAKRNAELNGNNNCEFFAGDILKLLPRHAERSEASKDFSVALLSQNDERPYTIITDPPRAGMGPKVSEKILNLGAEKIIYVSCNSETQAEDLKILMQKYQIDFIQPLDMFPQTTHVENIVRLKLR